MIRMKTIYAGPNGQFHPGQIPQGLSKAEEKALVQGGYADDVSDEAPKKRGSKAETATDKGAENAEQSEGA